MGITWNYFCKRREIPKIQAAYGKAVKVNGKKMTVEIAGLQAEETPVIVLLPGLILLADGTHSFCSHGCCKSCL